MTDFNYVENHKAQLLSKYVPFSTCKYTETVFSTEATLTVSYNFKKLMQNDSTAGACGTSSCQSN